MLQVFLLVSLESVERYFGGQLAAWKINQRELLETLDLMYDFKNNEEKRQTFRCGSIMGETHVCSPRSARINNVKCSYWTGSSPAWIDRTAQRPTPRRRWKTFCGRTEIGFAVNTSQPNEPLTENNERFAKNGRHSASSWCADGCFFCCTNYDCFWTNKIIILIVYRAISQK